MLVRDHDVRIRNKKYVFSRTFKYFSSFILHGNHFLFILNRLEMKRIILTAMVLLFVNIAAISQTVRNEINCPVTVTRECYDLCILVSSTTITVPPGPTLGFPSCPNPANGVIYRVCWTQPSEECQGQPPITMH